MTVTDRNDNNKNNEKDRVSKLPWVSPDKSTQAFILAVVIIFSYVIFFGSIIYQAKWVNNAFNYDGMKDLTATFGIIAAAVVGYYFGQKNLEQATKTAETMSKAATRAEGEAKRKKVQLKKEKRERVQSLNKAVKIYKDAKKLSLATQKLSPDDLQSIKKEVDPESLENTLGERLNEVERELTKKENEIDELDQDPD